jgi:hypothetical protein
MGVAVAVFGGMRSALLVVFAVLGGCDTEGDKAAVANLGRDGGTAAPVVAPATEGGPSAEVAQPIALSAADDAKLRRKYGSADMQHSPCIKRVGGTLQGRGCPAGIVVFGPYANVPGNAEVEFSMEIQSASAVQVHSDMGSQAGKRSLGAIAPQALVPNEKRKVGYRINLAQPDTAVETRVWLHGAGPIDFDITNLTVEVR